MLLHATSRGRNPFSGVKRSLRGREMQFSNSKAPFREREAGFGVCHTCNYGCVAIGIPIQTEAKKGLHQMNILTQPLSC